MKLKNLSLFLLIACLIAACAPQERMITIMTHDSFAISEAIISAFEQKNDVKVNIMFGGDAGGMLNRAILSKNAPVADILFGVDNTFLSRALDEDLFEVYQTDMIQQIPDEFLLDDVHRALPIDYGDVCINADRAYFNQRGLPLPQSLEDLTKPAYKGLLVVQNPATSSPGLAFLLATIAEYGVDGYLDYWSRLKENNVVIVNDWETAYYVNFSGSSGKGSQPMVVSYGTSPAAEVIFSDQELSESPTVSLVGENMCFRQIEFAGILKGTKNREMAELFIDYMLSIPFQEDIPMNMFVFPVNKDAKLPPEFLENVQIPIQPARLQMDQISNEREEWIIGWRQLMLQ